MSWRPDAADTDRHLADLASSIDRETALVLELRRALLAQRAAIARSDVATINAGAEGMGRVLHALDESRGAREARVAEITHGPGLGLDDLERWLGRPLPPALTRAREQLRRAAQDVAREGAINRRVLQHATAAGEAFLQSLFAAATEPLSAYGTAPPSGTPRAAGLLVNRRV